MLVGKIAEMLENRTGLVGTLSAWGRAPPSPSRRLAFPNHVVGHQADERFQFAFVESDHCSFKGFNVILLHVSIVGQKVLGRQVSTHRPIVSLWKSGAVTPHWSTLMP